MPPSLTEGSHARNPVAVQACNPHERGCCPFHILQSRSHSAITHQKESASSRNRSRQRGSARLWGLGALKLALNIFLKLSKESFDLCNLNFHLRERGFRR